MDIKLSKACVIVSWIPNFVEALLMMLLFFFCFGLQAEFVVEHSMAGNEAHKLLNSQKLNYMDSFSSDDSAGRQKRYCEENPPSTPPVKVRI